MMHQHEGGGGALLLVVDVAVGYEVLSLREAGRRSWSAWRGASFMTAARCWCSRWRRDRTTTSRHTSGSTCSSACSPRPRWQSARRSPCRYGPCPSTAARPLGRVLRLRNVVETARRVVANRHIPFATRIRGHFQLAGTSSQGRFPWRCCEFNLDSGRYHRPGQRIPRIPVGEGDLATGGFIALAVAVIAALGGEHRMPAIGGRTKHLGNFTHGRGTSRG